MEDIGNNVIIAGILLSIALVAIVTASIIEIVECKREEKARRDAARAIMHARQEEYRKQVLGR